MLGFLIGTACLIGLVSTLRRGSCHGGFGYRGHGAARFSGCGGYDTQRGSWEGRDGDHDHERGGGPFRSHGRGDWHRGGSPMAFFFLRQMFHALDTTPGQEKAIRAAMEELVEVAAKHRGEAQKSREDLARAMRSASFDETVMGELFARHDTALEALRRASVGALAKVHEALDEQQRGRLASLIERSGGFGFRGAWA